MIISCPALAGVVVGGSRFVFAENNTSMSVELKNSGTEDTLVKVDVVPDDGRQLIGTQEPLPGITGNTFIATPPLFVLKPGKGTKIRINRVGGELPVDRESLFKLVVAALPAIQDQQNNQLQIAVRNRMKLFYRPKGLVGDPLQAYQKIRWSRQRESVSVYNPTPYLVTLYNLKIDGKLLNGGMVAPFSHRKQAWCQAQGRCEIVWQSLDLFSNALPAWAATLNVSQQDAAGESVNEK